MTTQIVTIMTMTVVSTNAEEERKVELLIFNYITTCSTKINTDGIG